MMTNRGDDGDRPSGIASWREELMLLGEEMEVVVVTVRMAVVKQWRRNRTHSTILKSVNIPSPLYNN